MTALRDYQLTMVLQIGEAFRRKRRVLGVLPTGGGKTQVFAHIAASAPGRTLIVCHRRELIRQASAKLAAAGVAHGVIAPRFERTSDAVQVGSVQTLDRRRGELPQFDLVVLDEAHHAVAGQWRRLLDDQPEARILGVTATPERLDGRGLGDAFDIMVQGPSVPELIADEWLVPSRVFAPPAPDMRGVTERAGDFAAEAVAEVMDVSGVTGDAVEHYVKHAATEPAIAFCASVAHAHHVAEQFRAQGWRAVAVDGSAKVADRDAAIAGLVTGEVEVLCSCELISEGLDVPAVSAVILLRPTQSLAMYLQMVGRGMRPARGKRYLTVLDHAGNAIRHGLPDVRREWRLGADAPKVRAPAIRQCPICFAVHAPGPRCPGCGHVYTRAEAERRLVRAKDGTLTELSADDYRLQVTPLRQLVKDAQTRAEVEQIAAARGYSDVWVDITMSHKRPRREKTTAAQDFAA